MLDEKIERKPKALERYTSTVVPELLAKLDKAKREAEDIKEELEQLKADRTKLLASDRALGTEPPVSPADQARLAEEYLGKLKGLFTGPGRGPYIDTIKIMEEQVKAQREAAAGPAAPEQAADAASAAPGGAAAAATAAAVPAVSPAPAAAEFEADIDDEAMASMAALFGGDGLVAAPPPELRRRVAEQLAAAKRRKTARPA